MNTAIISMLAAACVFSGSLVGLFLHRVLRPAHLTKESQDAVRLGIGMLSVLSSLVLGLLIATAKGSYDTTDQAVRRYAAELALLNETLRDYGSNASVPRDLLRRYTEMLLRDIWPVNDDLPRLDNAQAWLLMERVREEVRALHPLDDGQKWLHDQALAINVELLRQRWLLVGEQGATVSPVVLVILVSWITVIFVSFGMNAPRNGLVVAAFLVCGLAIGGSIFLILEMDHPLDGALQISSWPIRHVLAGMNW
jgi:hypothetical protein